MIKDDYIIAYENVMIANKMLEQENKQLKVKYENAVADYEYEKYKNSKTIEYIKTQQKIFKDYDIVVDNQLKNILEILGSKEIKEIPQFKGTLEQLDNLTILGDKE